MLETTSRTQKARNDVNILRCVTVGANVNAARRRTFISKKIGWVEMKRYLKEARLEFIVSNLLAVLDVICVSYYPYLLSYVIDNFHSLTARSLAFIFVSFILSIVLISAVEYANKIIKARYQQKICTSVRRDVFQKIGQMDYTSFHTQKNEKYSSFLINDVNQLYTQFFENLIYLINSALMMITYTVILALLNWRMCLVIMGSLILTMLVPQVVGRKFHRLNSEVSSSKTDYLSRCEELLAAHDLFDQDNRERLCGLHEEQLLRVQKAEYTLEKYRSFVQIFSGATLYVQLILCFVTGLLFAYFGIMSIGTFASSLLYVEYVAQHSTNMVNDFLEVRSSKIYRSKCMEFLNLPSVQEQSVSDKFESLSLENLSYRIEDKEILHDLSYQFVKGKKYLITGANGSGKSTLLKILAGLIEPSDGTLLFNGNKQYNKNAVSYVPQKRYVFEGSLLDNISLFDSKLSQEQQENIALLCSMVHLGYPLNYQISRNGENLSGGEIAKICLIRELYRGKSILFIDEPMNDIDDHSEQDILNLLLQMDKTIIMVAHGLSHADQFEQIVICDGALKRKESEEISGE